jgi:hypothetical protein
VESPDRRWCGAAGFEAEVEPVEELGCDRGYLLGPARGPNVSFEAALGVVGRRGSMPGHSKPLVQHVIDGRGGRGDLGCLPFKVAFQDASGRFDAAVPYRCFRSRPGNRWARAPEGCG